MLDSDDLTQWRKDEDMANTVVVGVDGTETSRKAAQRAAEVAQAFDAELVVLVAADPSMAVDVPSTGGPRMTAGEVADKIAEEIAVKLRETAKKVTTIVSQGKPAEALVQEATRLDARLIVVGNRRVQGIGRVLGSVAHATVAHAPCDVLIVKTV